MFNLSTQMISIEETVYISNAKNPSTPPKKPQKQTKQTKNHYRVKEDVKQFSAACLVGPNTSMSEKIKSINNK